MESEKLTGKTLNEEGKVPNINSMEDRGPKIKKVQLNKEKIAV